ncbi:hypothetical protein J0H58_30145 [bacterium]|nr:hypothetical protein [bacterium]
MSSVGRRIRWAGGMAFAWVVAWGLAGGVVARIPGFFSDLPFAIMFAPFGIVTGVIFSVILMAVEALRGLDRLSLPLFAGCGAVSGVLMAVFVTFLREDASEVLVFGPLLALAGAGAAAGSLAVVRRSGRETVSAPEGGPI